MNEYRYSAWTESSAVAFDADAYLRMLSEHLLNFGDLDYALRRTFQSLLRAKGYSSIEESQRRLSAAQKELLEERRLATLDADLASRLRGVKQSLQKIPETEQQTIQLSLLPITPEELDEDIFARYDSLFLQSFTRRKAHINQLETQAPDSRVQQIDLRKRLELLDTLPVPIVDRMRELENYVFFDQSASDLFGALHAEFIELWKREVQSEIDGLERLPQRKWKKYLRMLRNLESMADHFSSGVPVNFSRFVRRYSEFLSKPTPRSFLEFIAAIQDRVAMIPDEIDVSGSEDSGSGRYSILLETYSRSLRAISVMRTPQIDEAELRRRLSVAPSDVDFGDLIGRLTESAYLRRVGSGWGLTPLAIRRIAQGALSEIYREIRKNRGKGNHPTDVLGDGGQRAEETKRYEFGDAFDLDLNRTFSNALAHGDKGTPITLGASDFEVFARSGKGHAATVLMIDLSWSMALRGSFQAAKKAAMAMSMFADTSYKGDHFYYVGFSAYARQIDVNSLPFLRWDESVLGTNLHHGLFLARRLLARHKSEDRQIVILSDGEPTSHIEDGRSFFAYPPSPTTIRETLKEVARCTQDGLRINFIMLDTNYYLKEFVDRVVRINHGRAFYTTPDRLGEYLLMDYADRRRRRLAG